MNQEIINSKPFRMARGCLAALTLFLLLLCVQEIKQIGQSLPTPAANNTITVTGTGDATAIPDIAIFSFGVTETATSVADAQTAASTKANAATKAMTDAGVAKVDIQTLSYNINPHYEYNQVICNPNASGICPQPKSVLTGYDVSETIQVKVRDLTKTGALLQTVGSLGVQNVSNLQFSIDKPNSVQDAARAIAINDAKTKAQTLASELGVTLGHVVNFSENGVNPGPIMYASNAMALGAPSAAVPAPTISTGEQKVTENVSVTYEIK